MTSHVVDELADLAVGALEGERRARVEAHLADCRDCAGAFADLREILGEFAGALPGAAPTGSLRARVVADVPGRLAHHAGAVAALLAIDAAAAAEHLARCDEPDAWVEAPLPGAWAIYVLADPANLRGFLRLPAGTAIGKHEHHGVEHTLVLQGALLDDTGRLWTPGETMTMRAGSRHTFHAFGALDCVCAVVLEGGYSLAA